jgi:PAS domain S-box-containing protein
MTQKSSATAVSTAASNVRELYHEIFERSIEPIAIVDPNGYYIEQNAAHQELTGFSDAELKGQTPAIHLGVEGFSTVAAALETEGRFRGVLESRGKTGVPKKIDLAAFAVRDANGEPLCFVGIKRDITENDRLAADRDARLRELECLYSLTRDLNRARKLEDVYSAALDALINGVGADRASILIYDSDNLMHFKAWRGLSDEYRKAVDGHSPWQRDERNARTIAVPDVLNDASIQDYAPVFTKEGVRSLAFIPIVYEDQLLGKFMVYYNQVHEFLADEIQMAEAVARHIAVVVERRKAEEALRRSEKLATAGKLAATVAHEINNPLEGIMNLAFLLRHETAGNDAAARYLEDLEHELKRVSLITRRTLAFYRDTEPPGRVQLRPLIEETVNLFQSKLTTASIKLLSSIEDDPYVHGSTGELRQVLANLIANAMEAIGTRGEIRIDVRHRGEQVEISIADTGPGIEPSKLNRIFEPFFTTKTTTGTGLGLPLSREIIQRHGGSMQAANGPTGGAVITINLPELSLATLRRA